MKTLTDHLRHDSRSLDRRRVYLGEGLTFEIESRDAWLQAEAIDLTHEGLGVAVILATDVMMPAVGEVVTVRYTGRGASAARSRRWCATSAACRPRRGTLPRIGLSLVRDTTGSPRRPARGRRYPCPDALAGVRGGGVPVVLRGDACASGSWRSAPGG